MSERQCVRVSERQHQSVNVRASASASQRQSARVSERQSVRAPGRQSQHVVALAHVLILSTKCIAHVLILSTKYIAIDFSRIHASTAGREGHMQAGATSPATHFLAMATSRGFVLRARNSLPIWCARPGQAGASYSARRGAHACAQARLCGHLSCGSWHCAPGNPPPRQRGHWRHCVAAAEAARACAAGNGDDGTAR